MLLLFVLIIAGLGFASITAHDYLIISGVLDSGNIKAMQLYNPSSLPLDFQNYVLVIGDSQAGTKDDILTNKKTEIRTTSSTPIGPGETFIIAPTGTLSGATNLVAMRDLASSNYNSATGKRYIALMTFDTDTGSYGDIVDMMGDATKGKGPYTGTGGVSSDNAAVTRLPSVLSFPRNRLTWDASEWKLEAPKVEITTTSEFTYFSYHISDTFVCAVNADCPPDALGAECISDRCIINDGLTVAPSPSPPLTPSPTIAPTTAPTTAAPTLPVTQAPTGDWYERPIFAGYVNSGGKVAIQIFNPSYNPMENNLYLLIGTSITTNPAEDAELIIELNFTESIPPGQSKVVSHGSAGAPLNMLGLNKAALSTVIGSSWLALSKNETGKLEILDVIGNPSTTGPWVDDASGVTTNGAAIKRKPTINIPDMSSPAWDANEWYFAEGEITSQSDFLYFRGHTQDNFVCKNHKSCSFNTFCAKGSQTCKSCDSCFADNDAFNNICPPRCRPLMFAGYVEDGMKKAVQIYNPNNVTVNLRDYTLLVERSTTTLKSSISPLWGKYESDHINITAGSTILLASMFAGTELHKFLEPSSLFQMSDWNAQFSFTGDDFLLLAAFEFGIEIVEKEFDDAYNDIYDRIDTIFDVIGSTIDSGPWVVNNEAGTEIFATRDYALKRNRTATRTYLGSYKDIYRDETRAELSGPYRWKPEEWYKAVDKKGDLDSSFDFFGYHMSDSFLCSKHEDCPDQWEDENGKISAGFCYKDRTCQLCSETELSKCVFDGDGIDGTCPSKCPQLCAGAIPMATCPQCRTKIPKPHTIGMESLDDSNEFILHWCSNETYHEVTPALSKRASANVTLTFYESDDPDSYAITDYFGHFSFNLTDRSTVKFSSESNMCSTSHPFEYSVHLKVTEPYTTASASLVLYDHCQLPKLTSKERATTMEAAPTWYRSKNTKNRADIIPYVAGSTSELVVLQWDMPLLNCEGCEVSDYTIFQSESDGDFKEEFSSSTSSNGTIRILRGLNTKIKYRYKVQAKTRVGNSKLSLSSSGFSPVAEPPDPPPLIYFSDINDTKVTVHVIKGDENGSPISEVSLLMYTMNETIRRNVTWDIDSFDSSIEIAGLEKDSPLHFTARLVNAAGISESSEVFKMKTDNPPCKYTDYELGEDIGCVEKDSAWIHGFDFRKRADARCKPLQREEYLALFSLSLNIPCEYLPLTSTEGKTVMSFSLLGITLCLAAAAFFAINSQKKIVKASQPVFMVNFFFVVSLSNTYGITMILPQSSFTLNLRLIIFNLSFALGVSLLNAKLFRVWKLFASKSARMLKKQRVTPRDAAVLVLLPSGAMTITLFIMVKFAPISWQMMKFENDQATKHMDLKINRTVNSQYTKILFYPLYFVHGAVFVILVMLLLKVRPLSNKVAEKQILVSASLQVMAIVVLVIASYQWIPDLQLNFFVPIGISIGSATLCMQFIYGIIREGLNRDISRGELVTHPSLLNVNDGRQRSTVTRESEMSQRVIIGGAHAGVYRASKGDFLTTFKKKSDTSEENEAQKKRIGGNIETVMEENEASKPARKEEEASKPARKEKEALKQRRKVFAWKTGKKEANDKVKPEEDGDSTFKIAESNPIHANPAPTGLSSNSDTNRVIIKSTRDVFNI